LMHCLLADSPPDTPAEIDAISRNQHRTAERGREAELRLERDGTKLPLAAWALELLDELAPIADVLDRANGGTHHAEAVGWARASVGAPDELPSARALRVMQHEYGGSHTAFALARSMHTRRTLLERSFSQDVSAKFAH